MMKFMYDVVDKESKELIRKDAVQKINPEDMTEEAVIEALKFFCSGPDEEVVNVRRI